MIGWGMEGRGGIWRRDGYGCVKEIISVSFMVWIREES